LKAYPVPASENGVWTGILLFTEDKLEAIVATFNDLRLRPKIAVFFYFVS
jgi:hypothetical protein